MVHLIIKAYYLNARFKAYVVWHSLLLTRSWIKFDPVEGGIITGHY